MLLNLNVDQLLSVVLFITSADSSTNVLRLYCTLKYIFCNCDSYHLLLDTTVYLFFTSADRSINHLLHKWNLKCRSVPLDEFTTTSDVFTSGLADGPLHHEPELYEMLIIERDVT